MNMLSSGRRVLQDLLLQPAVRSFSLSPVQSTIIVERWWEVPLSKVGSPPRLHPRRHRVYKLVEDTKNRPKEKMELILTQTVPKLGGRGDTVFVKKAMGRNKLLAEGLAVYPSPENKQIFAEELRLLREGNLEERVQTRTGLMTVEFLKSSHLKINRMPVDEFHVNKEILCRQFLKRLDVVVPPHALSFPFETVKDVGDYWCEVQVNGIDTVRVPVSVLPYEDPSAAYQRQLKAKKQQQEAENISEPSDETEATVRAVVSDATVEAEAKPDEDSVREVSEASAPAGASASEKTAASAEPSDDKTAPPSDSPKKD
ncbi:S ribosomal protein L9%2C mitochondrial [Xyrichtys novacula]|uniref:Large ribosomal subunit protein bL9m n=1 Tax=Xyrichtys novacula TaxID=13765 RepID=A0AAV1HCM2_XYRNO|nr:S ribosomal protein L9%2C mitochondrial [Xyrichtys novacula]